MGIDWAALSRAYGALTGIGESARRDWLQAYRDSDPAGATVLTEFLSLTDSFEGFMATRMPDLPPAGSALAEPESRVGPWRLVRPIGAGGMGQVWQARRDDGAYDQIAALKLLAVDHAALRQRFTAERQRLAQLEHPNIARIIDGGDDAEGRPYMVMEYVEGEQIIDWCDAQRCDRARRVAILTELCAALAHAHGRLVLHLDIKPANVLVNADGHVRLIDFGVAALLDDSRIATPIRALTLATAAPEQLLGQAVTAATDIFQAGMLGHALLTGTLPERQSDGSVRIDSLRLRDPDLDAIIAKACAADPEQRYGSASAMGDDLRNWAAGFPVAARAGGGLYRTGKAIRRYPAVFGLGALLVVSLVVGITVALALLQQAREARIETEFYLAEAQRDNQFSGVWADLMQRAFGNSADQDRLARFMLDYSETVRAAAKEQPEDAALVANVIGMHFMYRNDYPRALAVLEPWIDGGYGSEEIRFPGKAMLARALMETGGDAKAAKLLGETLVVHEKRLDAYHAMHAASASQLALITKAPADIAYSKKVLMKTRAEHGETAPPGYLENQLALMFRLEGDFAMARFWMLEDQKQSQLVIDTVTNSDTSLLNLAMLDLTMGKPLEAIEPLLAEADQAMAAKGASATNARRAAIEAELDLIRGDTAGALKSIDTAITLYRKFAGEGTPPLIRARLRQAEIVALDGRAAEARQLYDAVDLSRLTGERRREAELWQKLSAIGIEAASGGRAGQPWKPAERELAELCVNPELLRRYAGLVSQDLAQPVPCLARLGAGAAGSAPPKAL